MKILEAKVAVSEMKHLLCRLDEEESVNLK